jgi:hypothetical protein
MARAKSFERTPPTSRGFRLAGANKTNASVRPCRAVCGRRSIPSLGDKDSIKDYVTKEETWVQKLVKQASGISSNA